MIKNLTWKFSERIITQLISLTVSILLARLLEPSFYGTISVMMAVITIAELFVCDGLATALIQKKDTDELDYSTALSANILLSVVLYFFLFLSFPLFAHVFHIDSHYALIFRVLCLRIFFYSVHSVQQAYIARNMMFRKLFYASFLGTLISSVLAVFLAYSDIGIWTLVFQNLSSIIFVTIILQFIIRRTPAPGFSSERLVSLYQYSSGILKTTLLIQSFEQFLSLLIGRCYSETELAFYDKGKHFPYLVVSNINSSIVSVLFPRLASEQNNTEKMKYLTGQYLRFSSFLICPIMLELTAVAEPFIHIFLTDKWLPCVPLLQGFCINYLFYPLHSANNQATKALGESRICFRVELIKKAITLIAVLICICFSTKAAVYGLALCSALGCIVDGYPNSLLIDYSLREQIRDFISPFVMSLVMAAAVYFLGWLPIGETLRLFIQVASGVIIYLFLSVITGNKEFRFICQNIRDLF